MRDLSSLTRDSPAVEAESPDHRTAREVPSKQILKYSSLEPSPSVPGGQFAVVLEKIGKMTMGEGAREAPSEPELRIQPPHRGFGVLGMGGGDSPLGRGGPQLSPRKHNHFAVHLQPYAAQKACYQVTRLESQKTFHGQASFTKTLFLLTCNGRYCHY